MAILVIVGILVTDRRCGHMSSGEIRKKIGSCFHLSGEPLRYTPPRLHPICARSDRVSLVFLPPTRCTRHGVRYANRDPSIPAATHPKSNMPTTIPTCCWAMLGKKIPKPSRGRRRSSKILPSGRGLRGGRGYRTHWYVPWLRICLPEVARGRQPHRLGKPQPQNPSA